MNIMPSEEIPFFYILFLFLQKKTAHAQRNNGIDDFHILQLKPITKKSALKPKTKTKEKPKYLGPERACELGSEACGNKGHWPLEDGPSTSKNAIQIYDNLGS